MTKETLKKSWKILPESDIHDRKAAGVISPLRKRMMERIATAIIKKQSPESIVIHQYNTKAKRNIRLAVGRMIRSTANKKIYLVILWITHVIINVKGELQKIYRKSYLAISLPLESGSATA